MTIDDSDRVNTTVSHNCVNVLRGIVSGLLVNCLATAFLCCGCGPSDQSTTSDKSAEQNLAPLQDDYPASPDNDHGNVAETSSQGQPVAATSGESTVTDEKPGSSDAADASTHVDRMRLADDRPEINELRLSQNRIQRYESKRLILLSDLPSELVSHLPRLADQLFEKLEGHFGKLAEAADGSPFQVTGHLIGQENRFQAAGLMPPSAFTIKHGRHLNYQFWMFNPEEDYYRRHLLFHEFIHCFMTCECGMDDIPPLWYIEGMAEYFATHRVSDTGDPDSEVTFGVLPESEAGYEGWGRIAELRRSFPEPAGTSDQPLPLKPLVDVMPETVLSFDKDLQYASAWGLCWILQNHPAYEAGCAPLAQVRRRQAFLNGLRAFRATHEQRLRLDWLLVVESLREGFLPTVSFPVHAETPFSLQEVAQNDRTMTLLSARDWQDTGLRLQPGDKVKITCSSECQVNDQPKPWISGPQGVSVEYFRGRPLGEVVGILVGHDGNYISRRFPVGIESVVNADRACSLWLQVNDSSAARHNNSGSIEVSISGL